MKKAKGERMNDLDFSFFKTYLTKITLNFFKNILIIFKNILINFKNILIIFKNISLSQNYDHSP